MGRASHRILIEAAEPEGRPRRELAAFDARDETLLDLRKQLEILICGGVIRNVSAASTTILLCCATFPD